MSISTMTSSTYKQFFYLMVIQFVILYLRSRESLSLEGPRSLSLYFLSLGEPFGDTPGGPSEDSKLLIGSCELS